MNDEVKNLKLEIEVLKKRIANLESKERRRQIVKIIKIVIVVAILIVLIIYGYKWYQQIVDYYEKIEKFINNPINSIF